MAFENFSGILGKFSMGQRILALLMLLLTVVILGVAPGLVDALSMDARECQERMRAQEIRMSNFTREMDSLNNVLRSNQTQCTDMLMNREREFWEMLEELKRDAYGMRSLKLETVQLPIDDSLMLAPLPRVEEEFDPSLMIQHIESMQKEITKEENRPR